MRDLVSGFYYPSSLAADTTLKKCILVFDEIHFMDRPSFMFEGKFGMVGHASPLRSYEKSFRDSGVPLYVHNAPGGIVYGELLEKVQADLADQRFLQAFQDGLRSSARFRELHIAPGNYGAGETHQTIYKKLVDLDLQLSPSGAWELLTNDLIKHFDYSSYDGVYKSFFYCVAQSSVVLNFALVKGAEARLNPVADAAPYANLLSAKFARAMLPKTKPQIPLSDLSFAIFDELLSPETLPSLTLGEIIKYRKESADAREAFLEMLVAFHSKAGDISADDNYTDSIQQIIATEVRPAARQFRSRLEAIHESMFGKIQESSLKWVGGSGLAHLLAGLSWEHILMLGTAGILTSAAAQHSQARRKEKAARRECAISYVLDVESQE